ncbi:MAG: metal ABC transporter ATP-binding protein [Patescibacteria group bacterium]
MPILEVKNLNVEIGGAKILESVDFEVNKGDVLAIIGPNGAGKSVLLKALLGLISYKGEIKWSPSIKIGYVPQRMDIETDIPLTVEEFLQLRGKADKEKCINTLKTVQLGEEILHQGFGEISVGQRQRVLIAWAMLGSPDILLFDEPTADIDISGQESIYKMLHFLQDKMNLAIILVSHDLNVVYKYAEKVLCLNRRKLCLGTPQEVLNTEHLEALYGGEKGFYYHEHNK